MATSQISVRLDDGMLQKLEALLAERGGTRAAAVREAVRDWLQEERRRDEQDHLEARIAGSLSRTRKEISLVRNDVHVLMAFFDRFVRSYLVHTPPVPSEAIDAQAATASERYHKLMCDIPSALQNGEGLAALWSVAE